MRSEDWREAFAVAYSGSALYGDDGELQDNATKPFIDYRKDSAAEIGRKIRERQAAKDWRPIESAPWDGTRVLIFREGYAEPYCVAWWSCTWGVWWTALGALTAHGAVYWQPIEPPAPKGQQHAK